MTNEDVNDFYKIIHHNIQIKIKKILMMLLTTIQETTITNYSTGISAGTAIFSSMAVVCSWTRNRSLLWAFIAGVLSIFYVIYWYFTRTEEEQRKTK